MLKFDLSTTFFISLVVILTIIIIMVCIFMFTKIDKDKLKKGIVGDFIVRINTFLHNRDEKTQTMLFKGQLNPVYYKWITLLNSMKIDMPLFAEMPTVQFEWFIYIISVTVGFIASIILFKTLLMGPIFAIVFCVLLVCWFFSKTTKRRYLRIVDSINTENRLASDMKGGFLPVVKKCVDQIPLTLRKQYVQFIQNVEEFNYPMNEAIQKLNFDTGGYSQEFLTNAAVYDEFRSEGFENIFKDTQVMNNIKILARDKMEAIMNYATMQFTISFIISFGLFVACMVLVKVFRNFYLNFIVGQILFVANIMLLVFVYLRIQILRSTDL